MRFHNRSHFLIFSDIDRSIEASYTANTVCMVKIVLGTMISRCIRSANTYTNGHNVWSSSLLAVFTTKNASTHALPVVRSTLTWSAYDAQYQRRLRPRRFHTTNIIQQQQDLTPLTIPHHKPDISEMSSKDMKDELVRCAVNTKILLEKDDLINALLKAREQQLLPVANSLTSMKLELVNQNVSNIDSFLERSELETAFLQHSASIRSNIENIIIRDVQAGTDQKTGPTDIDTNSGDEDIRTELILEEITLCSAKLSIQEMHTELEQQLLVSPLKLLQSCVAIARVDGIITTKSSENGTDIKEERHRLVPSEIWKSLKVPDILVEAYIDPSDCRKSILLPSYVDADNDNMVIDGETTQNEISGSNKAETDTESTPALLSRMERIQHEMKSLQKASMKTLFHELENVWGISPRCIYVCTMAVLRVLNVVDNKSTIDAAVDKPDTVEDDLEIRQMLERTMANPQLNAILSRAVMNPSIRASVVLFMANPKVFPPNIDDEPELRAIFSNPVFIEQMQLVAASSSSSPQNNRSKEK